MTPFVLVVDDEAAIREFLQEMLWLEGYETAEATHGVEALARVEARRPDLVILDLLMPHMNGFELAGHLTMATPWPRKRV